MFLAHINVPPSPSPSAINKTVSSGKNFLKSDGWEAETRSCKNKKQTNKHRKTPQVQISTFGRDPDPAQERNTKTQV